LVTQSARKAKHKLCAGIKIEVWSNNILIEIIYARASKSMDKYINLQKQYIGTKQIKVEQRNKKRKQV
jgi:hypothetical protein